MPYFTPTPEAAMTAAYGRSLMGHVPMGYYVPNAPRELNGLGALRFNRAVARGMYTMPFRETTPAGQLGAFGEVAVDPGLLMWGLGALALGMFLLGGKHTPRIKQYRVRRLRRKLARLEA